MMIVGRKGRKKLKKIRLCGLQTHFRTDVLLKSSLMGSVEKNELLTSGFPLIVLAWTSFLKKTGLEEGGVVMHPEPAPSSAPMNFWTWVLPVTPFRYPVESMLTLC